MRFYPQGPNACRIEVSFCLKGPSFYFGRVFTNTSCYLLPFAFACFLIVSLKTHPKFMNNVLVFLTETSWHVSFGFCAVNNIIRVAGYHGSTWHGGFIEFLSCVHILAFALNFHLMQLSVSHAVTYLNALYLYQYL